MRSAGRWPARLFGRPHGFLATLDMQNAGGGGEGAVRTFDWMFSILKVRLICLTAAMDNERSVRLIDRAGFQRMGTRDAMRPDKSICQSHYWEMSLERWEALKAAR